MSNPKFGFRLHTLEVKNWGTFDDSGHHVTMDTGGLSSCLTGLNGSGKSTLIDALLTLLVPHSSRHYNVAATGSGALMERTVISYIKGAWGKEESAESNKGKTQFLRETPGTLTILLAIFRDEAHEQAVTLAQIHWITASGDHQTRFLIKKAACRIGDLGIANLGVGAFSAHFDKAGWSYSPTFPPYKGEFMELLHIPSDTALKLFCKTVSIKEVNSVTEFIRTLMLEPHNTSEYLDGIETHFADLEHIHAELQATKKEIELLTPVEKHYLAYRKSTDESERLSVVRRAAEIVLCREAADLLDSEISRLEGERERQSAEFSRLKIVKEEVEKRVTGFQVSLEANNTFAAITKLKEQEVALGRELAAARTLRQNLGQWLAAVGYKENVHDEASFSTLHKWAKETLETQELLNDSLQQKKGRLEGEKAQDLAKAEAVAREIGDIRNKPTKIPRAFRAMRSEICEALGLNEGVLPFIGELVDVRSTDEAWRETINVLLHSRALSLVVPEDVHSRVAGYVDGADFDCRCTYYKVPRGNGASITLDSAKVYGKLEIRPEAWCRGWLQEFLIREFPHRCCNTVQEFNQERGKAVTRNRHIKGSSYSLKETSRGHQDFDVLGWTNEAKLQNLQKLYESHNSAARAKTSEMDRLTVEARGIRGGLELVRKVGQIPSYRALDVDVISNELTTATNDRAKLEDSDSEMKQLAGLLKAALGEKEDLEKVILEVNGAIVRLDESSKAMGKLRAEYGGRFNYISQDFDWRPLEPAVGDFYTKGQLQLGRLREGEQAALSKLDAAKSISARAAVDAKDLLIPCIAVFLQATQAKGYATEWGSSVVSAPAMVDHLNKLRNERFHVQEAEFRTQMIKILDADISTRYGDLRGKTNANAERILALNQTLRTINYSEGTFIQIADRATKDQAVAVFRTKVEDCTANTLGITNELYLERFKAVKALIDFIRNNRTEAERGANPNNWSDYVMAEYSEGDPSAKPRWHPDSAGYSGGQKSKLACTIVAAAMAFQMKHSRSYESNAFRLVMIDEIFSKSDDVNSAYALSVFEKFDFQLLLVTPRDGRLKLVMPYVGSFHLAQNPTFKASTLTSVTSAEALSGHSTIDADTR